VSRLVLITGGAGFIGSTLARLLVGRGDRVRILDDLSAGQRAYLDDVEHELIVAGLADADSVRHAVTGVDAVVHLAAKASIPESLADPVGTFDVNVTRLLDVLDASRRSGVGRFVFASSNAAVGDHEPPASEENVPHPISPYGASKLAGEAFCQAYAASYGIAACSLRFANVYGPFSLHKLSVVAAWLRTVLAGEPLTINGDGEQTRDFIYVEDIARGVLAALDAPRGAVAGEVFQVGTGRETTINQLAAAVGRATGRRLEIRHGPASQGDVRRNVSRVDKAAERLGFRASVTLDDGLDRTTRWWKSALEDPRLAAVTPHLASGSE
jgi:UDP-glucose 4-epimerase